MEEPLAAEKLNIQQPIDSATVDGNYAILLVQHEAIWVWHTIEVVML